VLGIVIDAVVLFVMGVTLGYSGADEFRQMLLVAFGIAVANLILFMLLGGAIGYFALAPMFLLDGVLIMWWLKFNWWQALVTVAAMTGAKGAVWALLGAVTST
jgi:hypothetical protein